MSTLSFTPPLRQSHAEALTISQQAGIYIQKNGPTTSSISIPFLSNPDSIELWSNYENLLYSCLRTGDDKTAHLCLEKLGARFGTNDERVMGLRGLYQEAMAEDNSALMQTLHEYDSILAEDPTVTPVRKRRIALLRSLSRDSDAINALTELLEASPTDIESWAELCELYVSQGFYQQAQFCLEEILLSTPNAWNIHARLGEILYISAASSQDQINTLAESVRRFCRSIELCDGYLRGSYGLKLASEKLMGLLETSTKQDSQGNQDDQLPVPSVKTLQKLRESATSVLAETARQAGGNSSNPHQIVFVRDSLKAS
ncbi:MAG: hypothetical protein L6R40_002970 [Gallowayella cf. fulva]|nr:MAG: hypothetical protein L6R40_002970 [Xanthomendoza cf. fulva]